MKSVSPKRQRRIDRMPRCSRTENEIESAEGVESLVSSGAKQRRLSNQTTDEMRLNGAAHRRPRFALCRARVVAPPAVYPVISPADRLVGLRGSVYPALQGTTQTFPPPQQSGPVGPQ
jgi:hypothetical protein